MREESSYNTFGVYVKSILKFLISHIGLVSLVVGYTIIGAFMFEKLEAEHEREVKKNMSSVRLQVTDDLWDITGRMVVLNESVWADSVRDRLQRFEKSLIFAIKREGWDGSEDPTTQQWTFAGALFYSIILITTIGYGHIAPKTSWGKVVTIFYAIPGVPLMMLCLANIGDGMAHSFRFLYWKVCCYACTKRPKKKKRIKQSRSPRRYPSTGPGSRNRSSSFRRSQRASQRSADSQMSDSAFYSFCDPEFRMYDDMVNSPDGRGETSRGSGMKSKSSSDHHSPETRESQNSKTSGDHLPAPQTRNVAQESEQRASILFNKYALEKEGLTPDGTIPQSHHNRLTDKAVDSGTRLSERRSDREKEREKEREKDREPETAVTHQPKSSRTPATPGPRESSPPLARTQKDSAYYSRHLAPPDARSRLSRLEEEFYYDDYYDESEEEDEEEEEEIGERPVPIWLGVMLVVAYIFGGAFLFSGWEEWGFLDSVYFCFITLTTIGFGDFVPAQEKKENAELSIALCSLYLLFGIALLAMSFNLVQEEVINNVKSVAKRLGILKDEEEDVEV